MFRVLLPRALLGLALTCAPAFADGAAFDGRSGAAPRRAAFWTIANGLPQNSVNDLVQTEDGALWLATFAGLLRFDGVQFRLFDLESLPELGTSRITALALRPGGGLWLGTQSGVLLGFRDGRILERHVTPTRAELLDILDDGQGALWAVSSLGSIWRLHGGAIELVSQGVIPTTFQALCLDAEGHVRVAASSKVLRFETGGRLLETRLFPTRVNCISTHPSSGIWVGRDGGVFHLPAGQSEELAVAPTLGADVTALVADGAGGLWVGTATGPRHVRRGPGVEDTYEVAAQEAFPAEFGVRSLLVDREHNVWVGSIDKGLARLALERLRVFGADQGSVSALISDGHGGAWAAFNCNGLVRISADGVASKPEVFLKADGQPDCLNALALDGEGQLWMGLDRALLLRDGTTTRSIHVRSRDEGRVTAITRAHGGGVWVGRQSGALTRRDFDGAVLEQADVGAPIRSLTQGPDGAVWIGLTNRLLRYAAGEWTAYGPADGVPPGDVRDVLPDGASGAWIAVYGGGLLRWAPSGIRRIGRAQGLPDSSLSRLLSDGRGHLWMHSNTGLLLAREEELSLLLDGQAHGFHPLILGPEAGMPEANFGSPAGFRDDDGELWLGTIAGAVRVDANAFPFNAVPPTPLVELLLADKRPIEDLGSATIPAATKRVTVEYTAFALTAPERVIFRHRLRGFEEAWNVVGSERSASYTGLSPQAYEFEVQARNEDGIWSDHPASLRFTVLPRWWQTAVARSGFALLFLGALLGAHLASMRALRQRSAARIADAQAKTAAEERLSNLRDALAHVSRSATAGQLATSLAHEVNQPLAAIVANALAGQRFLTQAPTDRAELAAILGDIAEQGQRASLVIKRLRAFLGQHPVERTSLDLGALVVETLPLVQRELRSRGITVVVQRATTTATVQGDPVQLQQVLVNLLMNAAEASSLLRPSEITVQLSRDSDELLLAVRDRGPGFAPEMLEHAFEPFMTTKATGMGLGLSICRQIVEAHGGRLAASNAPDGGALLRLWLPYAAAAEVAR